MRSLCLSLIAATLLSGCNIEYLIPTRVWAQVATSPAEEKRDAVVEATRRKDGKQVLVLVEELSPEVDVAEHARRMQVASTTGLTPVGKVGMVLLGVGGAFAVGSGFAEIVAAAADSEGGCLPMSFCPSNASDTAPYAIGVGVSGALVAIVGAILMGRFHGPTAEVPYGSRAAGHRLPKRCTDRADCRTGEACDPGSGACIPACSAAAACAGGCCDQRSGLCVTGVVDGACGSTGQACNACGLGTQCGGAPPSCRPVVEPPAPRYHVEPVPPPQPPAVIVTPPPAAPPSMASAPAIVDHRRAKRPRGKHVPRLRGGKRGAHAHVH